MIANLKRVSILCGLIAIVACSDNDNIPQQLIDGGLVLPTTVTDNISVGGGIGGGSTGDNFCISGDAVSATIPELLTSSVRTLTFTSAQPDAPFNAGDQKEFTFSSSGRLFIDNIEVVSNPVLT